MATNERKTTVTLECKGQSGDQGCKTRQAQVSWFPGTSDTTIERRAKCALGMEQGEGERAAPLLFVEATLRAPRRRDAYALTATVPHGSRLRALTADEWLALPSENACSRESGNVEPGDAAPPAPSSPSFVKAYVDSLTRTEVGVLPTVQCCIHVNSILDVNPQSETFLCDITVICDWVDERLAGMTKHEIQELIGDATQYSKPLISIENQVDGGNELGSTQPRCENSETGACKITAKLMPRLHSNMDVHAFPFDCQTLRIETHLRSITVDKARLEKGQRSRLYVVLEDAGRGVVNTNRANKIAPAASKVQKWDFVTTKSHMACLLEPYYEQLRAHQDLRQLLGTMTARNDCDNEVQKLLDKEEALVKRLNALLPSAAPKYEPSMCNPKQSTHVVTFDMARQPHTPTWTLVVPVAIVTTLSFTQFGVDPKLVGERLKIIFMSLLTIVTFMYVVRDSVPAVPYITLLDQFITKAIGLFVLQCVGTLYTATLSDAYYATRLELNVESTYAKTSNKLLELLIESIGNGNSTNELAAAAVVDTAQRCDVTCQKAKEADFMVLLVLLGLWVGTVLHFTIKARNGRRCIAYYNSLPFLVPMKKLRNLPAKT